ncbi:MAG: serine/threonine protein kinase [Chthoniobacterales bacterium]
MEIGHGGFKTVFKGEIDGVPEVLKVISIPGADGSDEQQRFRDECFARVRREYGILARCESLFLVKLASVPLQEHEINDDFFSIYSEEFLDGPDLWKLIRAKSSLPNEQEAKLLMRCLVIAIKEIWSMRFIHRDIKPANVIKLNDSNRPFVLIDLGIAFGLLETGLTIQGIPCTARYLAPEMGNPNFRGNLDFRTDLYTIALTVFEYAAGQHPIARDSDDPIRTVTRALHESPKPLQQFRPDFTAEFCKLVDQLLKKKPTLRPANLDALIEQTLI